ncbi:MAG: acetyl-CoA carboxylase, biotin carboxyl carrier protein [Nitrospirae bacterium CG_4_9_14_3_um_filter_41_27]|nr:MAG: acetyl-CoA carboxylase, biotin carboxyl carrier protein [Nitrospirae bacterium CG11_big_fil_rev_8_21_14_0_20_41_14]PIV44779.1 MAG: acetyl-CoA carboxylase, biotin carboxyl carrier protein [Nitrospirae bacterium CG02_land_8_20_14_3_00_41_53]PIW87361.1 MAG: acetyl-CoA carboxylase, biotin carboxyl carrier protein [Nitrospirae bacterium CG_4_8_14_3_um_filter_41_47]PJA79284.1 MAG: acetyl-CoA carboxylase, biotin carboxyl carrier protein [Nitrospirae bacterium CG_4_9_14_3_um_filter_41_27]
MELEDLKDLIELLKETDITELQIEKDGTKVKIKREKIFSSMEMSVHKSKAFQEKIVAETEEEAQRLATITSPIVGTFYRSPTPEAAPFVEVGIKVTKGQVLCIVEAMKLMNEIESDVDGVVVNALVENGQPVEYGEPLFLIKPVEASG